MKKGKSKSWYAFSLVFQLGFSLLIPLLISVGVGAWLDSKFSTSPLFTLIGLGIGMILAGCAVYADIKPLIKQEKEEKV